VTCIYVIIFRWGLC